MKLKLNCTLRLKTDIQVQDIAEDINIIETPESMTDVQAKAFFEALRNSIKRKYAKEIFEYFDVELKELS